MTNKLDNLENALRQATSPQEEMEALLALSDYHSDNELVDGWNYGKRALRIAQTLNLRNEIARANETIGTCLRKLTEYPESLTHYELALDNYLGTGDLHGVARCYCGLGVVCGSMDEIQTSLDYFEEALSASRRAKRNQLAATVVGNMGHCYFKLGRYKDAEDCFQRAISSYGEEGSKTGIANMFGGLAGVYVYTNQFDKGLEALDKTRTFYRETEDYQGLAITMMNEGLTFQKMGHKVKAKAKLIQALAFARSIQYVVTELDCLKCLSDVCLELGEQEEAQKFLKLYVDSEREERQQEANIKAAQIQKRQLLRQNH